MTFERMRRSGRAGAPNSAHLASGMLRDAAWLTVSFALVLGTMLLLLRDINAHLAARGVVSGFAFLQESAKIPITNAPVHFEPGVDSYGFALWVGAINTFKISALAVILATVLGVAVGIGSLSQNFLLAKLSVIYVEGLRNIPVLLQILLWYQLLNNLPSPRQAWRILPHIYLSNRGLVFPSPTWNDAYVPIGLCTLLGVVGGVLLLRYAVRWRMGHGRSNPWIAAAIVASFTLPVAVWMGLGAPHSLDYPRLQGFNFKGGDVVTPEFAALVIGLSLYSATFIAEIVRGGILGVSRGQWEAAFAIGLPRALTLWQVILPQALRPIVPALTNEYLGILKNSSLAIAIGYEEIVSVGNTVLFETGQAVSVMALTMGFYIVASLIVSFLMHLYHRRLSQGAL